MSENHRNGNKLAGKIKKTSRIGVTVLALYGGATIAHQTGVDESVINKVSELISPNKPEGVTGGDKAPFNEDISTTVNVIAQPGDSLWSIASQVYPNRDLRPLVDHMIKDPAIADGIQVGEQVSIPASQQTAEEYANRVQNATNQQQG